MLTSALLFFLEIKKSLLVAAMNTGNPVNSYYNQSVWSVKLKLYKRAIVQLIGHVMCL